MRFPRSLVPVLSALLIVSLASAASSAPDPALARLCDEYWQGSLRAHPTLGTSIGDRRYDDRLDDITPAGIELDRRRLEDVLARARAFDPARLDPGDRLTRGALVEVVEGHLANLSCHFEDWVVDPLGGPQVELWSLPDYTTIESEADARKFVARCRAMGRYIDDHVANLRSGLARGRVAERSGVEKVAGQLDALLAAKVPDWSLMGPAKAARKGWTAAQRDRFAADLGAALADSVRPALARYRDAIAREILPAARAPEKAGLVNLPDGLECYRKRIREETSLDLSPEELHAIGLEQVRRFREELSALGRKVMNTGDIAEIQRRLRDDPAMHFATAAEVETMARETLARAKAAIPRWFGILPKAGCEVRVMGMHEAPQSTIAYYRNPAIDGSRPGYYMINTYKPETRPRYEAQALAFHESIPGHHLQIAIAMELKGLPEFRKHEGVTAFVEGWALYTERLADEMGLYSGDLDRIGMLSYDAWRSCRLVVDTGIHAMGWSRQQAIDYMLANTVLAENNIVNEVDRYITWPGQALAYKCGQIEILKLREEAKKRLGDRFDIKAFHDVVLRNGALALPVLREQVEAWIAEREKRG
ncbi:MAG TPA: DUF885 domain-containing protein [Candidatus Eisenbacteria bacterium]|jgi:uncharacterized protein (DUF885 family)